MGEITNGNDDFLGRQRIDIDKPEDVRFWTAELGCSEDDLRSAISQVGCLSDHVARYLAEH